MMRCRQCCGGATNSVHRHSSGYPGCGEEVGVDVWNPWMSSGDEYSKFESVGTPAYMNVQV